MNTAVIYLILMNLISFGLMGIDKQRARRRDWRIPEKVLFGAALLGGSVGAWAGMYLFHLRRISGFPAYGSPTIT